MGFGLPLCTPRFINEIEEYYHSVHVSALNPPSWTLGFTFHTREHDWMQRPLNLESGPDPSLFPELMLRMSDVLSARLTTVEVLRVTFHDMADYVWEDYLPWRRFYQYLPSVKTLQIPHSMARTLYRDHGEPDDLLVLPALNEINISESLTDESQRESRLEAFQPFVSARQQAGRPVDVFF